MQDEKLTAKQRQFVIEYLKDFNGCQSAIRAGYAVAGAAQTAAQLLTIPKIQRAIAAISGRRVRRAEINAVRVLEEAARVALSDVRDVFSADMTLKPVHEWSDVAAASVSSVEVTTLSAADDVRRYVTKVRLWPKGQALDMLMRHLGLFAQDNAQRGQQLLDQLDALPSAVLDALSDRLDAVIVDQSAAAGGGTTAASTADRTTH